VSREKSTFQLVWGIALVLAGIGVLYRIPQVMPRIMEVEQFAAASGFIYFCVYLMAVILIGGGSRKIYRFYRTPKEGQTPRK
jgi:hypothetical protein